MYEYSLVGSIQAHTAYARKTRQTTVCWASLPSCVPINNAAISPEHGAQKHCCCSYCTEDSSYYSTAVCGRRMPVRPSLPWLCMVRTPSADRRRPTRQQTASGFTGKSSLKHHDTLHSSYFNIRAFPHRTHMFTLHLQRQ